MRNPEQALIHGILEPLQALRGLGRIGPELCLILVDSLSEAEFHKPDYGDTIASFLAQHIDKFPSWLKLVVTVQSAFQDLVKCLPLHKISLDGSSTTDKSNRDLHDYITYRINTSASIKKNITTNGKTLDMPSQLKFTTHVQSLSKGNFLYCKMLLSLIERGHLVLKSSNYKILPVNLTEIFLLEFNLKFPSLRSFEKVSPILNVCLASLYPLTLTEIGEAVNSGYTHKLVPWDEFLRRMELMSGLLVCRRDGAYMFFHPAFRDWLVRRDESDSTKFLCDLR